MGRIYTSKGVGIMIDSEDYEKVSGYTWRLDKNGYPIAGGGKRMPNYKLHRFVLNAPKGTEVDHINHNLLDCRKENLRLCTHGENQHNQCKQTRTTSSKFKGVSKAKKDNKWTAQIKHNRKVIYLGRFDSERDAAIVYDQHATKLFGKFAKLNFCENED